MPPDGQKPDEPSVSATSKPSWKPFATMALQGLLTGWVFGRLTPLRFACLFPLALTAIYVTVYLLEQVVSQPGALDGRAHASAGDTFDALPWGEPAIWMAGGLVVLSFAACFNVIAKRIRDMGLPGGLATSMLAIILHVLISGGEPILWIKYGFYFAMFIALLTIATDRLEAGSGRPAPRDGNR